MRKCIYEGSVHNLFSGNVSPFFQIFHCSHCICFKGKWNYEVWGGLCCSLRLPSLGYSKSCWPDHPSSLLAFLPRASLVPVYSFGENDIYRIKVFAKDSWQYLCQSIIKKYLGFAPCIFWGRSLFSANSWGLLPFPAPITTVGESSSPGKEAVISFVGTSHLVCLPSPCSGPPHLGAPEPPPH